jgi:ribosomal protein S6
MKEILFTMLVLVILSVGCASRGVTDIGGIETPDWYLNPPKDDNYILGIATATSQDFQLAVDKAKQQARLDIAENLESRIMGLIKKFEEEVGGVEEGEYLQQFTQVSKNVVDQSLVGSRERDKTIKKEEKGFRVFIMMELPIGEAREELLKQLYMDENQQLYTRFRASQSFQELKEEIESLREYKKGEAESLENFE